MKPHSPSFEANLLYKAAVTSSLVSLAADIQTIAETHGLEVVDAHDINGCFLLMICDQLEILVASCSDPLPTDHFLQSSRPAASSLGEAEILARLTRHVAHITILVTNREHDDTDTAAHQALKRSLCWDLADCLQTRTAPVLAFWCEADMLYSGEEFERACAYLAARNADARCESHVVTQPVPELFLQEPVISAKAQDWIDAKPAPATSAQPAHSARQARRPEDRSFWKSGAAAMDLLVSMTLPNSAATELDRSHSTRSLKSAVRVVSIACTTATIGISAQAGWVSSIL